MQPFLRTILAAALAGLTIGGAACAQPSPAPGVSELHAVPPRPVQSRHVARLDGRSLAYTAEIGRVAIRDAASGEARGYMGYIAYRVPASGAPRPLVFIWNGGPGSNSAILHFEVAGPKRGQGAQLVDNAQTWLAQADLVFVDPIGTGFSRPARPEYGSEFYGTVGDVASVAEFVRAWRLLHAAEDAPIFLAGESWGAGRAASVGYRLLKQGLPVRGLVLISGGAGLSGRSLPAQTRTALHIAELAAVAQHHGKLEPGDETLNAALAWAREAYLPALMRASQLTEPERGQIVAGLSRFTGLPAAAIDPATLTVSPRQHRQGLLRAERKTLDTFDMRLTESPPRPFTDAIDRYLRRDLGYLTALPYAGLRDGSEGYAPNGKPPPGVGAQWNYATAEVTPAQVKAAIEDAVRQGGGPPVLGPPLPGTEEAAALSPTLRVLVAAGRFDSLASCAANAELGRTLPGALRQAMIFRCYDGGHMFYRDEAARLQFSQDIAAFLRNAQSSPFTSPRPPSIIGG